LCPYLCNPLLKKGKRVLKKCWVAVRIFENKF
jgi:hypothetical protein